MKRRTFMNMAGAGAALSALPGTATQKTRSASDATVHEWGTFTTVHGSDGKLLSGLQKEEEHLPWFVYSHAGMKEQHYLAGVGMSPERIKRMTGTMGRYQKGYHRPLANVTVKMETPVLYFYSEQAMQAKVKVGFEGGSISQWYPQRTGGEAVPKLDPKAKTGPIDFSTPFQGGIEWDVEVLAPGDPSGYSAKPEWGYEMWPAARVAKANKLKVGEEVEHFLFYRGVGNVEVPLHVSAPDDDRILIRNTGKDPIGHAFVFDRRHHGIPKLWWQGGVASGQTVEAVETPGATNLYEIRATFVEQLIVAGLNAHEAHAMVNTWQTSYFEKPGLRVFWIAPRAYTDQILPIQIDPAPRQMERVIVGRSEVLTPGFEQVILSEYKRDKLKGFGTDRYALAYAERAKQLLPLGA